jgi:hypothetical protein
MTDPEYFQILKYVKLSGEDCKKLGLPRNCYSMYIEFTDLCDPKTDIIAKYQENGITKYFWNNLDFYTCDLYAKTKPSVANKYIKPLIAFWRSNEALGIATKSARWGEMITIYHK